MKQILIFGTALLGLTAMAQTPVPATAEQGKVMAPQSAQVCAEKTEKATAGTEATKASRPQRTGPSGSTVYGYLSYRNTDDFVPGLYEINTLGESTRLWDYELASQYANLRGMWFRGGKLCGYAVISVGGDEKVAGVAYQELDLRSGTVTKSTLLDIETSMMPYMMSSAYNPADDYIYGFGKTGDFDSDIYAFKRAKASDPSQVEVIRELGTAGERCPSFCYSPVDKCFYGVTVGGSFVRMDTAGNAEELFTVPIDRLATSTSGLTFSPYDGCLLWNPAVYETKSSLYAVYPGEKRVELLKTFPVDQQFNGFVTDDVRLDTSAPQPPAVTSVDFEGPSLSGSVSFMMPDKLHDGTPVTSAMNWSLKGNGRELASGTAQPGQAVTRQLSDLAQGDYTLRVEATHDGHTGYPGVAHRYIGHDTPEAPGAVTLTPQGVSWQPSARGVHNGYLDLAQIKYEVSINGTKVGETPSASLAYTLPDDAPMDAYRATVIASANGLTSEPATSEKLVMGRPFDLPYTVIPTAEQADLVVTQNRDGSPEFGEWRFVEDWGGVACFASGWSYEQPDDWLILPAVNIPDNSVAYKVTAEAARGSSIGSREYFEIWVGTEPDADAMTIPVLSRTRPRSRNWEDYSNVFAVPRAGRYYVAIHGCSDPDMKDLIVRNIRIEATTEATAVPAAVSALEVTATSDADLTATVAFTLPDHYINGGEIPADTELKAVVSSASTVEVTGTPGQRLSATVSTQQGDNTITVHCIAGALEGQEAEVMTFTGQDLLSYIEDYEATLSEDNMSAHLTWKAPKESLNGGYFATTGIKYWVAELLNDGTINPDTEPVLAGTDVFEYDYTLPAGTPQAFRRIAVIAENAAGLSPARWYAGFAMGTPYAIPMVEKWENINPSYQPLRVTASGEYADGSWAFGQPELVDPSFAHPSNPYTLVGYTDADRARLRITMPKFATDGGATYVRAQFDFFTGANSARDITILASSWGMAPEVIARIPEGDGWTLCDVFLPAKFIGKQWVDLAIDGYVDSPDHYLLLSSYTVSDATGIGGLEASTSALTFDGRILRAAGLTLTVADATGLTVKTGQDELDLSTLPAGIYIATATADDAPARALKLRLK